MSLVYLLKRRAGLQDVSAYLDHLPQDHRVHELSQLGLRWQASLYELAGSGAPVTFGHFVPDALASLEPVIHEGVNTFPVLRRFQKRFARPDDGSQRLFGYNHGVTLGPLGPGFFVVESTVGRGDWADRGALVIDYFQVPDGPVPGSWPQVVPNSDGLQRFVYDGTRDFMRRVSSHVSVGRAYKGERALPSYFVLTRDTHCAGDCP